jgi:hypothetical protein
LVRNSFGVVAVFISFFSWRAAVTAAEAVNLAAAAAARPHPTLRKVKIWFSMSRSKH